MRFDAATPVGAAAAAFSLGSPVTKVEVRDNDVVPAALAGPVALALALAAGAAAEDRFDLVLLAAARVVPFANDADAVVVAVERAASTARALKAAARR